MSERKVVSREFAVALGAICVALLASLAGTVFYQTYNYRADTAYRDRQITQLQNQVDSLTDLANLKKAEYWLTSKSCNEPAGSYMVWSFAVNYAGYVWVNVESSTSNETYVQVYYQSHGVWYDNKIDVGHGGAATFPVLPGNIEIRVGNTNTREGATQTVTATYIY